LSNGISASSLQASLPAIIALRLLDGRGVDENDVLPFGCGIEELCLGQTLTLEQEHCGQAHGVRVSIL
jgi:hypothetical protein